VNFNFDTFEFTGLIAPGSVVVLAVALLYPQLLHISDPTVMIAVGIVAAYVVGHLVAAIGNIAELIMKKIRGPELAALRGE